MRGFKKVLCVLLTAGILAVSVSCTNGGHPIIGATKPPININVATPGPNAPTAVPQRTPSPVPTATPRPIYTPDLFPFTGASFVIANLSSGNVIFNYKGEERNLIASITKLMIALVAMDYFTVEDKIVADAAYFSILTDDTTIDHYGVKVGTAYSVSDLLKMLLLKSYADAALMLAYASEEKTGINYLTLMNKKAEELGMTNTHFDNCIGLDIGNGYNENYSTAIDVCRMLIAVYNNEDIASTASLHTAKIADGTQLTNSNLLLATQYASSLYTTYAGKTGSTNAAGLNVASTFISSKGVVYAVVYLHGETGGAMYSEVRSMLEYVIENDL